MYRKRLLAKLALSLPTTEYFADIAEVDEMFENQFGEAFTEQVEKRSHDNDPTD